METCNKCGIQGERASAANPDEGLCWQWPEERWLCPNCLKTEIRKVVVGIGA